MADITDDQSDTLRGEIADAFYDARDAGRTMTEAAIDARDRVVAKLEVWGFLS